MSRPSSLARRTVGHRFKSGERLLITLLLIAVCYVLVYGIVIKYTISNSTLFALKTYVPEILLLAALFVVAWNGMLKALHVDNILLLCLMLLTFCLGTLFDDSSNAPVVMRDVYIPLFFLLIMSSARLSGEAMKQFIKALQVIMVFYLLGSLALYAVEAGNGYEWTARFYTGYTFWGTDPVSKIVINTNDGVMRLPALAGSSVKSGMYAVIALALFLSNRNMQHLVRQILIILSLVCIWLFNSRTPLFVALVIVTLSVIDGQHWDRKAKNTAYIILFFSGCGALLLLTAVDVSGLSMHSMFERLEYWKEILTSPQLLSAILVPYAPFSLSSGGSGIQGATLSTVWDNAYLYFLYAFGFLATVLVLVFFARSWQLLNSIAINCSPFANSVVTFGKNLILATGITAFTTNIFQGRSWFFMVALLLGVVCAYANSLAEVTTRENAASYPSVQFCRHHRYQTARYLAK